MKTKYISLKTPLKIDDFQNNEETIEDNTNEIKILETITDHIGFGHFHYIALFTMSLSLLGDGCEILVGSLLFPAFKSQWGVEDYMLDIYGSCLFIGFVMGPFLSGYLSDKVGRKTTIEISTMGQFILGFISAFSTNFTFFIIVRSAYTFLMGVSMPVVITYVSEISPTKLRGKFLAMVAFPFGIGELYVIILCMFLMDDDLKDGNIPMLLVLCALPALLTFLLSKKYVIESPRFSLCKKQFQKAFEDIEYISQINKKDLKLSTYEKELLQSWANNTFEHDLISSVKRKIFKLFNTTYLRITIIIWALWFIQTVVWYGSNFCLPTILVTLNYNPANYLIIMILFEIVANFLAFYLIDHNSFGRKKLIIYSYVILFIVFIVLYYESFQFILFLCISKFFVQILWCVVDCYTPEVYKTDIRSIGLAAASVIGRVGGIIMPWVIYYGYELSITGPFLYFALFCLAGAIAGLFIPFETKGTELDKH